MENIEQLAEILHVSQDFIFDCIHFTATKHGVTNEQVVSTLYNNIFQLKISKDVYVTHILEHLGPQEFLQLCKVNLQLRYYCGQFKEQFFKHAYELKYKASGMDEYMQKKEIKDSEMKVKANGIEGEIKTSVVEIKANGIEGEIKDSEMKKYVQKGEIKSWYELYKICYEIYKLLNNNGIQIVQGLSVVENLFGLDKIQNIPILYNRKTLILLSKIDFKMPPEIGILSHLIKLSI